MHVAYTIHTMYDRCMLYIQKCHGMPIVGTCDIEPNGVLGGCSSKTQKTMPHPGVGNALMALGCTAVLGCTAALHDTGLHWQGVPTGCMQMFAKHSQ